MGNSSTRWQFVPRVVKGVMNGASQVLPTGSGQMLYYEILDGIATKNSLGYQGFQGEGRLVGAISYDFVNARWGCNFFENGLLRTHQPTEFNDDIGAIKNFIAGLTSPPVPLTDEVGNDVTWPASLPVLLAD
jgi:hypothetical protein